MKEAKDPPRHGPAASLIGMNVTWFDYSETRKPTVGPQFLERDGGCPVTVDEQANGIVRAVCAQYPHARRNVRHNLEHRESNDQSELGLR